MSLWKEVDETRYNEMLEILPPAVWIPKGFLVGEPWNHRICKVSGQFRPTYAPFVSYRDKFYECDEPMTGPEFRAFDPSTIPTSD
jgi:hypothetical protein